MGSRAYPSKALLDIEGCVSELKQEFSQKETVINDDCSILHSFQEKLESVLQFGLIEKTGFLGPKKSYWNYITACLASSKRKHDGINFVKCIASLKTSLGRGRAFLRFCLAQKCLADTLQVCFVNQKVSRDFYSERSVPVQESLWSSLVNTLYELNDLNFDLNAGYTELDIAWPKFARKVFTPETGRLFSKNMSSSSLQSFLSQDEYNTASAAEPNSSDPEILISDDASNVAVDTSKLMEQNEALSLENRCLQNKVTQLEGEKSKLVKDFQELLLKYEDLQHENSINTKSNKSESIQVDLEEKDLNFLSTCTNSVLDVVKTTAVLKLVQNEVLNDPSLLLNEKHRDLSSDSIKSVIEQDLVANSNCALSSYDESSNESSLLNSNYQSKMFFPQNQIYMSELLQEIKTVIDDIEDIIQKSNVTLALPYIARLKKIRNSLEEKVSSYVDKSKTHLNFSHFVENCVSSLKNFIIKQEIVIHSLEESSNLSVDKNQSLYSRISVLKNLLKSYGFLKILNEKDCDIKSVSSSLEDSALSHEPYEEFLCDNLAHDPLLKRIIVPLLPLISSSFIKLNTVKEKMSELDVGLNSAVDLINLLIIRLQDQEMHLKGVTRELEEAQNLVSVLKEKHTKLQSAEGIFKYDLQEKRKLLGRLRQQLENTREDFNLVRLKNSKSEAEWKDLRKEFVQRHKQTSEESGFLEDRGFEDRENTPNSSCASNHSEENISEQISLSESPEVASPEIVEQNPLPKKSRLELLEEQCQSLYSNLLQSSKRRVEIDRRLENICTSVDKRVNRTKHKKSSSDPPVENCEVANKVSSHASCTDICEVIYPEENCVSNPLSSPDVGSPNSDLYVPETCKDASLSNNSFCESSKTESCNSFLPQESETAAIHSFTNIEKHDLGTLIPSSVDSLVPSVDSSSGCISKHRTSKGDSILTSENQEQSHCDDQSSLLSHVDSLLIKKKDLEESLRNLADESDLVSSTNASYLETEECLKQISALEEERIHLLDRIRELEKKSFVTSEELDYTKHQLILSKATKEHEVSTLQFQLDTEALKYEEALKEFSEQSKGLESMKQKVTDQEELILTLEEALTEIRVDCESEKDQQWKECLCDIEEERNRNEILLSQIEELKIYNKQDKDSLKSEFVFLQNYSQELQKKLVKLLKEKDILWKRNIQLYHLQKEKVDDRWMEDSEVSSCLGCKNNFSFMLRKHHCRLCGRIFCYVCSNNWLLTASSSKKLRSCNECFMQYMEMKKSVRRGSDVPQVDEDSGDEIQLPFIPKSNGSITSEVPSSINDSIMSLPIIQKQSTPRFASVPDLRYVFKSDEGSLNSVSLAAESPLKKKEKLATNNDVEQVVQLNHEACHEACTSEMARGSSSSICRLKEITVNEIKESGQNFNGDFSIRSAGKVEFLLFCDTCPIVLQWCFTPDTQDISLKVMIKSETHSDDQSYLCCQEKAEMQDEMLLEHPGHYMFCFDNSNRNTETKVQYSLSLKDAVG